MEVLSHDEFQALEQVRNSLSRHVDCEGGCNQLQLGICAHSRVTVQEGRECGRINGPILIVFIFV